jgi:hypothetical protein
MLPVPIRSDRRLSTEAFFEKDRPDVIISQGTLPPPEWNGPTEARLELNFIK